MSQMLTGHCHCGAIRVTLEASRPAAELGLRACQCSFCRRHGALTLSDPEGHLYIEATPGAVNTYRFGLGISDFLLCAECGCYVAVTMQSDIGLLGVLNAAGVALPGFEDRTPEPMIYDDETPEDRVERRKARWMPATLVETQPSA